MGDVLTPYRLRAGDTGPIQRTPVSCGAACLTVARMTADPVFASWVRTGHPHPPGAPAAATEEARFAAYEQLVLRRTNGLIGSGGAPNLPWPRRLGTPPWGARRELERGAARAGARYQVVMLRPVDAEALAGAFERLLLVVAEGAPALLYVGDSLLPRHVTLVLPGDGDSALSVYDPHDGRVGHLRRDALVERRLRLAGWDVPWFSVQPDGAEPIRVGGLSAWARVLARAPRASAPT
jgi:hypothetical protein